eukprot:TRINITY_DN2549_c0_g3_i1.p1 TRINITY_DN2549_c0_g3~~TRINITY_DN2549_c0_g3_i1.p1  ORF type:complete len:119 (-),score=22.18 TRINITY_DN2549_c0_g3_i1:208-564(-)
MDNSRIVICGGGIVGAATLYYLSLRGVGAILIERNEIACAASGKAGGFLAMTWGDGSPTEKLHHVSFNLHRELAKTLNLESYRNICTLQGIRSNGKTHALWLDGHISTKVMMDFGWWW